MTKLFEPFPKISRLVRDCTVTEKVDGSNGSVCISLAAEEPVAEFDDPTILHRWVVDDVDLVMRAGSRTRWITPGKGNDNFGFAAWVEAYGPELEQLGVGNHYGEWWGRGIQRGYEQTERKFSLFNTARWGAPLARPACCDVVPVLYEGPFDQMQIRNALAELAEFGSRVAPGFMDPEGIVVYHHAAKQLFKQTVKNDEAPKGVVSEAA